MTGIPRQVPPCAQRLLSRSAWFANPVVFERACLLPANRLARFIASPTFSKRHDIAATTLGHAIYFQADGYFDPHSPAGLSLLAHELKHVEQIERKGTLRFYLSYLLDYLRQGYGEGMPQEQEAYDFGRAVHAHLTFEMAFNADQPCCLISPNGEHNPNPAYILQQPMPFRAR
jgi:hypothetical protein